MIQGHGSATSQALMKVVEPEWWRTQVGTMKACLEVQASAWQVQERVRSLGLGASGTNLGEELGGGPSGECSS